MDRQPQPGTVVSLLTLEYNHGAGFYVLLHFCVAFPVFFMGLSFCSSCSSSEPPCLQVIGLIVEEGRNSSAELHFSFVYLTASAMVAVLNVQDLECLRDKSQGTPVWEFLSELTARGEPS